MPLRLFANILGVRGQSPRRGDGRSPAQILAQGHIA